MYMVRNSTKMVPNKRISKKPPVPQTIDQEVSERLKLLEQARKKVQAIAKKTDNPRLVRDFDRFISSQITNTY